MTDDDLGLQRERTALARRRTWLAYGGVALLALRSSAHNPALLVLAAFATLGGAMLGWRRHAGPAYVTAVAAATSLLAVFT